MLRIRQVLVLAGLTALEALRQPICLLLTGTCVLLTALAPMLVMHVFGEEGKLARDSGLAFHFVFGMFVAGHAACACVAREIRCGTTATVLSKPVGRTLFFASKFAGVAAVVLAFSACATLATLLSERVAEKLHTGPEGWGYVTDWRAGWLLAAAPFAAAAAAGAINWALRRPFESTAFLLLLCAVPAAFFICGFFDRLGRPAPLDFRVDWRILPAAALIAMALLVLAAAAMAVATRLPTVPTLTVVAGLFLAGLVSDHFLGRRAAASPAALFLYRLIPNWQNFWLCDALTGGGAIAWSYVAQAGLYAAACVTAFLGLGALSFAHVEMK
ncbi:MAG: ABC transporter permease [Lentisphaerae bacterium]|nr:ABC transporter permease [Lentisphaerota bacterium]